MHHLSAGAISGFITPLSSPNTPANTPPAIEHIQPNQQVKLANLVQQQTDSLFGRTSPISGSSLLTALNKNQQASQRFNRINPQNSPAPRYLAAPIPSIPAKTPSFLSLGKQQPDGKQSLYISGFGLFKTHISEIQDIASHIKNLPADSSPSTRTNQASTASTTSEEPGTKTLATHFKWPNTVAEAPYELLQKPDQLIVSDGFLFPIKKRGGLYALDKNSGETTTLLAPKKGWFYHQVAFHDMNGDGKLDIVTARSNAFFLNKGEGELLWAEAPNSGGSNGSPGYWKEHIIGQGPDFLLKMHDIDHDGKPEILVPEYSNEALTIYKQMSDNPDDWQRHVILDDIGPLFDLEVVDLNQDGKEEILLTNHVDDLRAGLFVLKPTGKASPLSKAGWEKVTLMEGIETRKKDPGNFSPGSAITFQADPKHPHHKPHILLSGDGAGFAYVLQPESEHPENWHYSITPIIDEEGSMLGMPLVLDLDDAPILMVPVYEQDQIHLFQYSKLN